MEQMRYDILQQLAAQAEAVEAALVAYSDGTDGDLQVIFDAQRYSLLGGGKRIRPFLVNEFCRVFGGTQEASMPFACAIEMIHTYSLIHDDLPCMDDDDLRRGKPTNHKVFGYSTALLAGDALLTKAFLCASENRAVSAEARAEAVRLIAKAAGDVGMIGGQIIDLDGEKKKLSFETLLRLHALKTGALIECSALLGALAAGVFPDDPRAKAASEYARSIGLAFQVIDDILDRTASAEELGKSVGGDAEHNKTTFLTYYDCEGAKAYAAELTERAIAAVEGFEGSDGLVALAKYLLERKN